MLSRDGHVSNHFHSFAVGPVRVVAFSTEFYYYRQFGEQQIQRQFRWLERELARANADRAKRPWIVTMAHKPLYCQTTDRLCSRIPGSSSYERAELRRGVKWSEEEPNQNSGQPDSGLRFGLEKLLKDQRVDIELFGHEHNYQRLFPLFDDHVLNGTPSAYHNPRAPVVVVTGSAVRMREVCSG